MVAKLSKEERQRAVNAAKKAGYDLPAIAKEMGGATTSKNLHMIIQRGSQKSVYAESLDDWLIRNRFALIHTSSMADFRNRIVAILDIFDDPLLNDEDKITKMLTCFHDISRFCGVVHAATNKKT